MFEFFWKTFYYFFSWFGEPHLQHKIDNTDNIDTDEIEYGILPDIIIDNNIVHQKDNKSNLRIKIPQYEFIMLKK